MSAMSTTCWTARCSCTSNHRFVLARCSENAYNGVVEAALPTNSPRLLLARFISIALHPFLTFPLSVAFASRALGLSDRVAAIVSGVLALSIVFSAVYTLVQVRRGEFSNIDVSTREQRPRFYAVLIGSTLCCAGVFYALNLPHAVIRGSLISSGLLLACFVVNFRIKASLHVAYTVFPIAVVWQSVPFDARVFLVLIVPAMIWSRVTMGRHTLHETVAGATLATVAGIVLNLG